MIALRRLLSTSPKLVALLIAAAMLMRLVPAGFMPTVDRGSLVLTICSGQPPMVMTPSMHGGMHHGDGDEGPKSRCAYADLALPLLGGADAVQLAAALAFVLALGLTLAVARPTITAARLWPPLRGPPTA